MQKGCYGFVKGRNDVSIDRENRRNVVATVSAHAIRVIRGLLKFVRSNQYYSSPRYMRENVGKQCTHVHCNTAIGEEVQGVRRM